MKKTGIGDSRETNQSEGDSLHLFTPELPCAWFLTAPRPAVTAVATINQNKVVPDLGPGSILGRVWPVQLLELATNCFHNHRKGLLLVESAY